MLKLIGMTALGLSISAGSPSAASGTIKQLNHNPIMPKSATPLTSSQAAKIVGRNEMTPMFFAPMMQTPPGASPLSGPAVLTPPIRTDLR